MDAVRIREAIPADHDSALDLLEAVAAERRLIGAEAPINRGATRSLWLEEYRLRRSAMFVATGAGRVLGVGQIQGEEVSKLGMYVEGSVRRRGIGSRLLRACLDWARAEGVHKVVLEVWPHNAPAIALYEKFGFEKEAYLRARYRRRSGELWDCLAMGLTLDGW